MPNLCEQIAVCGERGKIKRDSPYGCFPARVNDDSKNSAVGAHFGMQMPCSQFSGGGFEMHSKKVATCQK